MGNTVFVLGAGASNEFNFPLNSSLKGEIIGRLKTQSINEKNPYISQLIEVGFKRQEIFDFCRYFEGDHGETIDEFLSESLDSWGALGKHAIAQTLISYENPVYIRRANWCRSFLSKINNGLSKFNEKDISFITFNYDRSLEFALIDGLFSRYNTRHPKEIITAFQKIKIVHVHGMIGNLEYDFGREKIVVTNWRGGFREYNTNIDAAQIVQAAAGINIVHENIDDSKEYIEARNLLKDAKNVAFMGFGFNKKNFDRLTRNGELKNKKFMSSNRFSIDTNIQIITENTEGLLREENFIDGNALTFIKQMIKGNILFL